MKRLIMAAAAALIAVSAFAQAQINTKKMKIGDFTERTLKVVLTGSPMFDEMLKDEVRKCWTATPYEFCTLEEFEKVKVDMHYYFLLSVKGTLRKESQPGLEFLTLVKGGPGNEDINDMYEVVSLPYKPTVKPSGREMAYLGAFVNIIQEFALEATEKDITGYAGLVSYCRNLSGSKDYRVVLCEDDIAREARADAKRLYDCLKFTITDEDEAEDIFTSNAPKTLVSYCVSPTDAGVGSWCYKMLIDADTHTLFYYRRHKISAKAPHGFSLKEVEKIARR